MKNEFKGGIEPTKQAQFKPTDKSVMVKTTGRNCDEYHVRNVPQFEIATVSLKRKGLFWLGAISLGR